MIGQQAARSFWCLSKSMKIDALLELARDAPSYRLLLESLSGKSTAAQVIEEAKPYLLASLYTDMNQPILLITSHPEKSHRLAEHISAWLDSTEILEFPEPDNLPYSHVTTDAVTRVEKLRILSQLVSPVRSKKPLFMVSSVPTLLQKLPSSQLFRGSWCKLREGMNIEPGKLLSLLIDLGYKNENLVEIPGSFSRRGGIVDIFPLTSDMPVRLEFFGNTIESLRLFETINQRSLKPLEEILIGPASDISPHFTKERTALVKELSRLDFESLNAEARQKFENFLNTLEDSQTSQDSAFYASLFNSDTLLSYLPPRCLVVLDEPKHIEEEAQFFDDEARQMFEERLSGKELPPGFPRPYFTWNEFETGLQCARRLELPDWQSAAESEALKLDFSRMRSYAGQLPEWIDRDKQLSAQNKRIIAVSHQAKRLGELLSKAEINVNIVEDMQTVAPPGSLTGIQGLLPSGWELGERLFLFPDSELFGFLKQRRTARRRHVAHHKLFSDIKPGDYIVHIEHGVGRFSGVTTMNAGGITREYMLIEYAAGDRLYVPTDQIDRIERYIGAGDHQPTLNRLGSAEWVKTKQKARESAIDIAEELLEIYAAREVVDGFSYSPDNVWQTELEASFPYVETPDQISAISQIKDDMARPRPMDRLVCGDVGYGKTEVALRAAFKAVMDGRQVAVLVPTTILAQQHYDTFKERLAAFPVRIESLSRFKSRKEQLEIAGGIADGSVDIAIGTHRLIQKDITFKNLGLLIIDEEQRFGVNHKEHFKRLRKEVDVLTLSATPIPRTLNLSLAGVRDMSVMETPPEERLPIRTHVAEYDEQIVREAIVREMERNGQVFFVHNRVQSIGILAEKLEKLVPEARIAVGHGQMPEDNLEKIMSDFAQGNIDVLLCTTIIESGLDVPNANTLIINQADRLGLTQLYQLRGRVGRGANIAYAYFLYDKGKRLTAEADQRLRTIYEATELGAGFGIAMKDLEIRGAGNILGVHQSGHINSVGFSLYTQLLSEAVDELKSRKAAEKAGKHFTPPLRLPPPTIDLPQPAYIPETYVADTDIRLGLYKNLAASRNIESIAVLGKDFIDRFGSLPYEVENLLYATKIKVLATNARLESISTEGNQIVLRRPAGMQFNISRPGLSHAGVKLSINQIRLDTGITDNDWHKTLEEILTGLAP
jgi:transcription-repair coupling factor (superfamily II helicase)